MNWLAMKRQNPDLDKFQLQLGGFFYLPRLANAAWRSAIGLDSGQVWRLILWSWLPFRSKPHARTFRFIRLSEVPGSFAMAIFSVINSQMSRWRLFFFSLFLNQDFIYCKQVIAQLILPMPTACTKTQLPFVWIRVQCCYGTKCKDGVQQMFCLQQGREKKTTTSLWKTKEKLRPDNVIKIKDSFTNI